MKILITSAGKKIGLIHAFQRCGAYVVAQDSNPDAKGCSAANEYVDKFDVSDYDLVIPTRDAELLKAANLQRQHIVVSSPYTIRETWDKAEFYRFCRRHDFDTPVTSQFNAIVKPRNGSGSRGQMRIDRSMIVQEIIPWQEYTVDYFSDPKGNTLSVIPRKRLSIVDGESTDFELSCNEQLIQEATRLGTELKIIGPATLQCFFDREHRPKWFDVNCRFGGGSHFTWSLFDSPKWIVDHWLN